MTDIDYTENDKLLDAEALSIIGRVFESTDLDKPKVILTALVSLLSNLLAIKAIQDDIDERKLDVEVKSLVHDIRQKSTSMHRLLTRKLKEREEAQDTGKTVH